MIKLDKKYYTITLTEKTLRDIKQLLWCAEEALKDFDNEWRKVYLPQDAAEIKDKLEEILGEDRI